MKKFVRGSLCLAAAGALAIVLATWESRSPAADEPATETQVAKAADRPGWKLVWSDEFDRPEIDRTKWDFDRGNGFQNKESNTWISGWGNSELEFYTDRAENVFVRDGLLHIRAIKEQYKGFQYTSARLNTRKKDGSPLFASRYGRFNSGQSCRWAKESGLRFGCARRTTNMGLGLHRARSTSSKPKASIPRLRKARSTLARVGRTTRI